MSRASTAVSASSSTTCRGVSGWAVASAATPCTAAQIVNATVWVFPDVARPWPSPPRHRRRGRRVRRRGVPTPRFDEEHAEQGGPLAGKVPIGPSARAEAFQRILQTGDRVLLAGDEVLPPRPARLGEQRVAGGPVVVERGWRAPGCGDDRRDGHRGRVAHGLELVTSHREQLTPQVRPVPPPRTLHARTIATL